MEYEDNEYQDYQFVSIVLNPTFLNIQENLISTTVAENGRIGFQDTDQSQGLGFFLMIKTPFMKWDLWSAIPDHRYPAVSDQSMVHMTMIFILLKEYQN